jgi:ubiquinone/menaquinone biosynthesis C-methylase UbiE
MHPELARLADRQTGKESPFERCWWLYAMCREHLFTDHTQEICRAIEPLLKSGRQRHLLEVGCGPGYYSRRLAARFPELQATGIDISEPLLCRAREKARRSRLENCRFLKADALSLADFPNEVDIVIASRLFLILANRDLALNAIFMTLRPGGVCFIAEPTSTLLAALPLWAMQLMVTAGGRPIDAQVHCEVLSSGQFERFLSSQPWGKVHVWQDRQYQCALCEKAA